MRIHNLTSLLLAVAITAAFALTGCIKKPKLDLTGVQANPAYGDENGLGGDFAGEGGDLLDGEGGFIPGGDFGEGGVVDPFANGDGLEGNGAYNGNGGLNGGDDALGGDVEKGGAWAGTDAPVAESGANGGFLKSEQRWKDCIIYFAYDQYEVAAGERAKLDSVAKYLLENPTLGVVVEGHADERGSDEYNRALGERRALAVTQYLGLMGVAANRCKTISYGEDRPAVPNATKDSDHQLNRRAEFLIGEL